MRRRDDHFGRGGLVGGVRYIESEDASCWDRHVGRDCTVTRRESSQPRGSSRAVDVLGQKKDSGVSNAGHTSPGHV